jgi:hypothetical protein
LELVIGTWGAVSALLIPAVNQLSLALIGLRHRRCVNGW